jgi:hypothetical protein
MPRPLFPLPKKDPLNGKMGGPQSGSVEKGTCVCRERNAAFALGAYSSISYDLGANSGRSARFEVRSLYRQLTVFWNVTPYSLVEVY